MYQVRCLACDQPGTTSADRREIQDLTDLHNRLLHGGAPVATIDVTAALPRRAASVLAGARNALRLQRGAENAAVRSVA